jgi:hypothetical protein
METALHAARSVLATGGAAIYGVDLATAPAPAGLAT